MWIMADCETESWSESNLTPKLKMINCIVVENDIEINRRTFRTAGLFITFLEELYQSTHKPFRVYFHNLDFDSKYLWKILFQRYNIDIIRNQSMLALKCRTKGHKYRYSKVKGKYRPYVNHFEFRDSLIMFYHLSVKKLGDMVNLPKIDFKDFDMDPTRPEYIEYCFRDCEIVIKAMIFLRDMFKTWGLEVEIEDLPLTLPALSFNLFKLKNSRFIEESEDLDGKIRKKNRLFKVHPKTNEYFRQYYFGGRCEVFDMITEPADYTDINGLYQYIMDNNKMPIPEYKFYTPESFNLWNRLSIPNLLTDSTYLPADLIFAIECTVNDWCEKPVFCERIHGKSMFRSGQKRVLLTREEYQFCLDYHIPIIELHRIDLCREWSYCFEYFKDIYALRNKLKAENNPGEKLVKLPPNATYGKLGQFATRTDSKVIRTDSITAQEFVQIRDNAKDYWIVDDCLVVSKDTEIKFCEHNLALASRITALARLCLYSKFMLYESRGVRVKYCDTDSIVIPHDQFSLISDLVSNESGGFKIEESFQSFCALAPKEYLFLRYIEKDFCGMNICEQSAKIKGCTKGKMEDLYFGTVKTVRPMKFSECLRENHRTDNTDPKVIVRSINFEKAKVVLKQKRTFYDKRIIGSDFKSRPLSTLQDYADNELACYTALHNYLKVNTLIDYQIPRLTGEMIEAKKRPKNKGRDKPTSQFEVMKKLDKMDIDTDILVENFDPNLTEEENIDITKNYWRHFTKA